MTYYSTILQAAFHGSVEAARILLGHGDFDGVALGLHEVADKEGKTPIDLAKDEKNNNVAKIIQEAVAGRLISDYSSGVGIRKRK